MISFYKTINGHTENIHEYEVGCWINCISPNEDEKEIIIKKFGVEPEFLRSALDEEESSHIDTEENNTLLIIDIPTVQKQEKNLSYSTSPLAIIITEKNVLTVSIKDNPIICEFEEGIVRDVNTNLKTQFVLHMMLRITTKYLQYLKQIDRISDHVEQELRSTMKNKDLIQLLEIEKSLVYFSSSLKSNEITMSKIMRGRIIKLYEEDQDLLEDVLIEVKQAIDMSSTYLNTISSTMDAFSSIISNNLNVIMKVLASITLIMSIPTIISGFYGMNIHAHSLPMDDIWWFPFLISLVTMIVAWIILKKKDML